MNNIEKIIKKNNIKVITASIDGVKGCYIKYKNLHIITLDPTLSEAERKEVLKHEVGHFLSKATYKLNEKNTLRIRKAEERADEIALQLKS